MVQSFGGDNDPAQRLQQLCLSKCNLALGSKPCSEAEITVPSHHLKLVSTESNHGSRGIEARDTLSKQVGISVWKPWEPGNRSFALFSWPQVNGLLPNCW